MRQWLAALFGVVIGAAVVFSCAKAQNIPKSVVDFAQERVFKIHTLPKTGMGSAILLTPHIMITACHVVSDYTTGMKLLGSQDHSLRQLELKTIWCDPETDVAVLQVIGGGIPDVAPLPISNVPPRQGTEVYGLGHALGGPLIITVGHWQSIVDKYRAGSYLYSAPTIGGDSGSPLVYIENGKVRVAGIRLAIFFAPTGGAQIAMPFGNAARPTYGVHHYAIAAPGHMVNDAIRESIKLKMKELE